MNAETRGCRSDWKHWGGLIALLLLVPPGLSSGQSNTPGDMVWPNAAELRQSYAECFREVVTWGIVGVAAILFFMFIVAFVTWYTPTHIPRAKPFDPERERREPRVPIE